MVDREGGHQQGKQEGSSRGLAFVPSRSRNSSRRRRRGTACNIFLGSTEFTDNIPAQAKVVEQHGIDLKCAWQKVERPWITNAC